MKIKTFFYMNETNLYTKLQQTTEKITKNQKNFQKDIETMHTIKKIFNSNWMTRIRLNF